MAVTIIGGVAWGCRRTVTLTSDDMGTRLVYDCADIRPQATKPADIQLVRKNVVRLAAYLGRLNERKAVAPYVEPYAKMDGRALEQLLVQQLCDKNVLTLLRESPFPDSGSAAPFFDLPGLVGTRYAGRRFSLVQFRGRYVLIAFSSFRCRPCIENQTYLAALDSEYAGAQFQVLGIMVGDSLSQAAYQLGSNGLSSYPFLMDPRGTVERAYDVHAMPRMFLIDTGGAVVDHCTGCDRGDMSLGRLRERLRQLLSAR